MVIFSGLGSPSDSDISSIENFKIGLDPVQRQLRQLASAGNNSIETKLGLNESSRIVLNIIKIAQRAKKYRKECTYLADQAYQLVNAVDGGVKGRAIDVNNILRDHIGRLNEDLGKISQIIKGFASWWILFRNWSGPRGLQQCHDILNHGMDMYLLLLRCSLAQPTVENSKYTKRASMQHELKDRSNPMARPLSSNIRRNTYPSPNSKPLPSSSTVPGLWSQPPYQTRGPGAVAF